MACLAPAANYVRLMEGTNYVTASLYLPMTLKLLKQLDPAKALTVVDLHGSVQKKDNEELLLGIQNARVLLHDD